MDDDDRRLMGLMTGRKGNPMGMFGEFLHHQSDAPWASQQPVLGASAKNGFDDEIGKIVDDAVKSVFSQESGEQANTDAAPDVTLSEGLAENDRGHRHHHHHHRDEEAAVVPSKQQEVRTEELSDGDKSELATLLTKLTASDKTGKLKEAIHSALFANEAPAPAPAPAAPLKPLTLVADEIPTSAFSEPSPVQAEKVRGASRPAAPLMTSHIEKAPLDFIPESVYAQQAVPFKENLPELVKHVPKRILIPRMEEPGPVIGGSSRPVHIQIPSSDIDFKSNTRPAPPSTAQMLVSSEITTQVDVENKADVSVKASAVAAANDEALTQPEVVIF